jgi:chitinase
VVGLHPGERHPHLCPGQTVASFAVPIADDTVSEGDETVPPSLSTPAGGVLGAPAAATLTIHDNDPVSHMSFGSSFYAGESCGTTNVNISLGNPTGYTVTVHYRTAGGTATPWADYIPVDGTATIAPGQTWTAFTVNVLDDTLYEPTETVDLELSDAAGATLGALPTATLTIADNDTPPTVSFGLTNWVVGEGVGNATVSVELSAASGQTTVHYATADGSATTGQDYTAVSGALTFAPGRSVRRSWCRSLMTPPASPPRR